MRYDTIEVLWLKLSFLLKRKITDWSLIEVRVFFWTREPHFFSNTGQGQKYRKRENKSVTHFTRPHFAFLSGLSLSLSFSLSFFIEKKYIERRERFFSSRHLVILMLFVFDKTSIRRHRQCFAFFFE